MKFKHIVSLVTSFFLSTTAKSQKNPVIKKETSPQVNTKPQGKPTSNNDMKIKGQRPGDVDQKSLPGKGKGVISGKHLPGKENSNPRGDSITSMKHKGNSSGKQLPGKEIVDPLAKQKGITSVPITVKPGTPVFIADFSKDEEGEMPAGWKTNGLGTITKIEGTNSRWLNLEASTNYETAYVGNLPSNFKIEFDFLANYDDNRAVPELVLRVFRKGQPYREAGLSYLISPNGGSAGNTTRIQVFSNDANGGEKFRSTAKHLPVFQGKNGKNEPVRVSLSVKNQQVKAWIDGEKVYDLQDVLPGEIQLDHIGFEVTSYGGPKTTYNYYISNLKVIAE